MRIIIPMAGAGKRMRPHTLTTPKPLLPIAGKPIVQRLAEDIAAMSSDKIEEIAFVIGNFGKEVENQLLQIAEKLNSKGKIYYQDEPLGTAHAILCAKESLVGNVIVAFADTLFDTDFKIDKTKDGVIFVEKVKDPSQFGVVKIDKQGIITDFVEKSSTFVSDLAIIGIYFFKDGEYLRKEMQFLIDNNIKDKGEYQLTNAMENMKNKGSKFLPGTVKEWLDCGNKDATVYTNKRILELRKKDALIAKSAKFENATVIEPCFIGENVLVNNSVIGPYVSIGEKTVIENSIVTNSIILTNCKIQNAVIDNSMLGNFANYFGKKNDLSISDYSTEK